MQTKQDKLWELIEARRRSAIAARAAFNVGDLCNAVHSKLQCFDLDRDIIGLRKEMWHDFATTSLRALAKQIPADNREEQYVVMPEAALS